MNNHFQMFGHFDNNGSLRVDDIQYDIANLNNENYIQQYDIDNMTALWNFANNKKSSDEISKKSEIEGILSKKCSGETKNDRGLYFSCYDTGVEDFQGEMVTYYKYYDKESNTLEGYDCGEGKSINDCWYVGHSHMYVDEGVIYCGGGEKSNCSFFTDCSEKTNENTCKNISTNCSDITDIKSCSTILKNCSDIFDIDTCAN